MSYVTTTTDSEVHEFDIGTRFLVTLKDGTAIVDISTATLTEFIFLKPDGTSLTKTATFVTDGTDGQLEYFTIVGDLTPTGLWKLQVHVVMPAGEWRSDVGEFRVYENLPA